MMGIALALVTLDLHLTRKKTIITCVLVTSGPICAAIASCMFTMHRNDCPPAVFHLLVPAASVLHGLWLLWFALKASGVEKQEGPEHDGSASSFLPMNFRTVILVDVFRWIGNSGHGVHAFSDLDKAFFADDPSSREVTTSVDDVVEPRAPRRVSAKTVEAPQVACGVSTMQSDHKEKLREELKALQSANTRNILNDHEKERVERLVEQFRGEFGEDPCDLGTDEVWTDDQPSVSLASEDEGDSMKSEDVPLPPARWLKLHGYSDFGAQVPYYYHTASGEVKAPLDSSTEEVGKPDSKKDESPLSERKDVLSITMSEERMESLLGARDMAVSSAPHIGAAGKRKGVASQRRCSTFLPPLEEQSGEFQQCEPHPAESREADKIDKTAKAAPMNLIDQACSAFLSMEPGQVPWHVLRNASVLLACLWFVCAFLSLGIVRGPMEFGTPPMMPGFSLGDAKRLGSGEKKCAESWWAVMMADALLPGSEILVDWPQASAFIPRSLSCDPSGKHLVIADDFGVYHGELWENQQGPAFTTQETGRRRLRGLPDQLTAKFERAPPCIALEGQALKDIGAVCSKGEKPECRVLVLHTNGRRITECPLPSLAPMAHAIPFSTRSLEANSTMAGERATTAGGEFMHRSVPQPVESRITWSIAGSWLNTLKEQVESLAVDNECRRMTKAKQSEEDREFLPEEPGCVVVGTTEGRVVQLRRHVTEETQLVPEWTMDDRKSKVSQGSLHVFPGGFVMLLRPAKGSVQALSSREGDVIGEWRLPHANEVDWLTIAGGGNSLYLLGRKKIKYVFWRFPVPDKLKRVMQASSASFERDAYAEM